MRKEIKYKEVKKHWDKEFSKSAFRYGDGYKIDNENFALIRFKAEIRSIRKILRRFKPKKHSFLDIGCGNGKYSFYFSKKFKDIVGVDFSKRSINIAKTEVKRRRINNIKFYCLNINKLKLNRKFDVIFVGGVLMYINDKDLLLTLKNLKDHLNEKGIIILREPFFPNKRSLTKSEDYQVIYRSLVEMKRRIKQANLKLLSEELNPGYVYGIIVDFYSKLLNREIIYNYLIKSWFLRLNHLLLNPLIKCKGYFLTVREK